MLDRYIKPGDFVLDIGGGPGRYSLYLAEKGCDATLFDLSPENTKFASKKAVELNLPLVTVCGDAREADELVDGNFDHVLLMGPLYHLLEETDRVTAVNAALNLLKPGGIIFVSFINLFGTIGFGMKECPDFVVRENEAEFLEHVVSKKSFRGDKGNTFTRAYIMESSEILPFMARFPLEKLHLFGQESIMSPCEDNIMPQPKEIVGAWLDFCEKRWEREDLLSWSEHLMYVGRHL
jgi:2-polyprenyl-3-methyl-5-hydroxy-6-metoxy-1,4-benzoquinol methylase